MKLQLKHSQESHIYKWWPYTGKKVILSTKTTEKCSILRFNFSYEKKKITQAVKEYSTYLYLRITGFKIIYNYSFTFYNENRYVLGTKLFGPTNFKKPRHKN